MSIRIMLKYFVVVFSMSLEMFIEQESDHPSEVKVS